jgi:hypothetical protein
MSAWRRLALELFPKQRNWIQDRNLTFSIYQLFFDLLPIAQEAHNNQDTETLEKIYYYAEWCWKQKNRAADVYNAVAVAFYEHLIDHRSSRKDIPQWIKPEIFNDIRVLFEQRLTADEYQKLLAHYNIVNGTDFE